MAHISFFACWRTPQRQQNLFTSILVLEDYWASSWDYGTYRIGDQRRLRRACACTQSRQSLRCLHTWSMEVDEGSDQKWHLAPLDGCACAIEEWVYEGQNVPKSHELALLLLLINRVFPSNHISVNSLLPNAPWKGPWKMVRPRSDATELIVWSGCALFALTQCFCKRIDKI